MSSGTGIIPRVPRVCLDPEVEGEGRGGPAAPGAALTRAVARGGAGPSTCADVRGEAGPGCRAPSRLRPTVNAPFPLIVALSCVRAALPQGAPPTPARFCGSALTPVVTQLIRKIRIAREGMLC